MNRSQAIDILRAVAVMLVLGRHMEPCPSEASPFLGAFSGLWHQGGWVGVDLFFVLSGFLVSGLLFQEHKRFGSISVKNFFIRRGLKIYPAFWVLIGITLTVKLLGGHAPKLYEITSELLFFQNYGTPLWGPNWSLAVEEHFYLLLAFLLFALARARASKPFAAIPLIFGTTALVCLILRIITACMIPYHHAFHLFPSHLRMDSLFFGVLLSFLNHYHYEQFVKYSKRYRWILISTGALLLLPTFVFSLEKTWFIHTLGLSICYLGSGMILAGAISCTISQNPALKLLAFVGAHSYSIYLWHSAVERWGTLLLARIFGPGWNWFYYASSYLIGAILFGIVMSRVIEIPVLRLRDRWFPSKCRPAWSQDLPKPPRDSIKAVETVKAL